MLRTGPRKPEAGSPTLKIRIPGIEHCFVPGGRTGVLQWALGLPRVATPVTDQYPLSATLGASSAAGCSRLVECHWPPQTRKRGGGQTKPHSLTVAHSGEIGDEAGACTGSRSKLGIIWPEKKQAIPHPCSCEFLVKRRRIVCTSAPPPSDPQP